MIDPAEKRKDSRYSISEYLEDEFRNVNIEIMTDPPVRAFITNISMNGLGFEIPDGKADAGKKIEGDDKFYINIHIGGDIILVNTKKIWGAVVKVKKGTVYQGGVMFTMVSPNDRLILQRFLEHNKKEHDCQLQGDSR